MECSISHACSSTFKLRNCIYKNKIVRLNVHETFFKLLGSKFIYSQLLSRSERSRSPAGLPVTRWSALCPASVKVDNSVWGATIVFLYMYSGAGSQRVTGSHLDRWGGICMGCDWEVQGEGNHVAADRAQHQPCVSRDSWLGGPCLQFL